MAEEKPLEAVAISYHPGERAPKVVARGRGDTADRIVDTATSAGVPVISDPGALTLLAGTTVGREIPPEAYRAVACILAFVYALDAREQPGVQGAPAASGGT